MECEAALKTSSRRDASFKFCPQAFLEELSSFNLQNLAPSDDFFVDDLLDFSHQDALPEQPAPPQQPQHRYVPVSPRPQHQTSHTFSVKDEFSSGELILPADDEAHWEWLSHFVEDSFLECSATYPAGTLPEIPKTEAEKPLESETPVAASPCFLALVPAKARSKRTRTGVRVWSLGFPPIAESSSSSTSSSPSLSSSPYSTWLSYDNLNPQLVSSETKPPTAKKPKKRMETAPAQRRCIHCGVQKTPQWRTGPLGVKTLCNACGVRYKSGRLLPEYRPACSPTFSSESHSNHHRKVLEMRRKKEMSEMGSGMEAPPVVPSS